MYVRGDYSAGPGTPLVVCLHYYNPATGDHSMYSDMFADLAEAGIRVLAPDMPGHGKSAGPAPSAKPESKELGSAGRDVVIRLLDYVGAKKAILVGYDWGGGVALESAVKFFAKCLN